MGYQNLRDFITQLERVGELKRITIEVDPDLEITEICDRTLRAGGPALLFEHPKGSQIPLLGNLFGTTKRVALGINADSVAKLREVGQWLAFLKEPTPPRNIKEIWHTLPLLRRVLAMAPRIRQHAPCQETRFFGSAVDLRRLPIQHCWPDDVAPLITWGLVVTKGPEKPRQNLAVYRMQVLGPNRVIMRWLAHRGGALDFRAWRDLYPERPFPVAVAIGADPATLLSAVTPVPDHLSEYAFAGLLRGQRTELTNCLKLNDLQVPAQAEIILEGYIYPNDYAPEGPFGDHTGYYNEIESFPVLTIECLTHRRNPIYHSTYTGKPIDEPAILGIALNEIFIPILQKQFSEIKDFYLPPEGCSYRLAVVSIKKQYPGHAKRIMMGIWSVLRQFLYTKFIIIVDEDINPRHWSDVIWAVTTRMDPARDILLIENTPIDYLDFAAPIAGLGSKIGLDATNKWPGETNRVWGTPIQMTTQVRTKIDQIWAQLGISNSNINFPYRQ